MSNQNIWLLRGREKLKQERRAQNVAFLLNPNAGNLILGIGCAEGFVKSYLVPASFVIGADLCVDSLLTAKLEAEHFVQARTY